MSKTKLRKKLPKRKTKKKIKKLRLKNNIKKGGKSRRKRGGAAGIGTRKKMGSRLRGLHRPGRKRDTSVAEALAFQELPVATPVATPLATPVNALEQWNTEQELAMARHTLQMLTMMSPGQQSEFAQQRAEIERRIVELTQQIAI